MWALDQVLGRLLGYFACVGWLFFCVWGVVGVVWWGFLCWVF